MTKKRTDPPPLLRAIQHAIAAHRGTIQAEQPDEDRDLLLRCADDHRRRSANFLAVATTDVLLDGGDAVLGREA